jgi:hypothetical protein
LRGDELPDRRSENRGNSSGTEAFDIRLQPARNLRATDNFVECHEARVAVLSEERTRRRPQAMVAAGFRRAALVARPLLSANGDEYRRRP